jgi:hypothetical protein
MKLSSTQIEEVKKALIEEIKELKYGERIVRVYVALDNLDLELAYELKLSQVIKNGLVLNARLIEIQVYNEKDDYIDIVNEDEIGTITVKL